MPNRPRGSAAPRPPVVTRLALAGVVGLLSPVLAAAPGLGAPAALPGAAQPAALPGAAQPAALPGAAQPVAYRAHDQLAPLDAERAWQHSTGAGVTVAVLDSGVDADHPDLTDQVAAGHDYVDGSTDGRKDPVGHGTTVASLVAGGGDPAVGLAPDATILPVRVLDEQNRYRRASTVARGVVWAVDNGADVINLSLGGEQGSASLSEALSYAIARDVVVVACTGNETDDYQEVWYPAREPGVVAVAGLNYIDGKPVAWRPSLTGPETVLAAPAVMSGAQAGGGYREVQGTSFSSALVTATAALIRAARPDMSAADVVNRLVATAEDLGEPGRDPDYGYGAVDPVAALTATVPAVPRNPLDTKARSGTSSGFGAAPDQPREFAAPSTHAPPGDERVAQPAGGAADRPAVPGGRRTPAWLAWVALGVVVAASAATGLGLGRWHRLRSGDRPVK